MRHVPGVLGPVFASVQIGPVLFLWQRIEEAQSFERDKAEKIARAYRAQAVPA